MARTPDRRRTLTGEIRKQREQVRRVGNASPFFGTGMHPNGEGGLDSDNYVAGESGYSFRADGNAEFNDLTLRGGIIGNEALTNPVKPDVSSNFDSGFSIGTTYAVKMTRTWVLPAGFNVAQISGTAKAVALNDTAGVDYLYVRSRITRVSDGMDVFGYGSPVLAPAGGLATGYGLGVAYVPLNPGDSIRLQVECMTSFGTWSSSASNVAEWSGMISWYRL